MHGQNHIKFDSQVFRGSELLCLSVSPATCHCFDFPDYIAFSVPDDVHTHSSPNIGLLVIHPTDAAAIPRIFIEFSRR